LKRDNILEKLKELMEGNKPLTCPDLAPDIGLLPSNKAGVSGGCVYRRRLMILAFPVVFSKEDLT